MARLDDGFWRHAVDSPGTFSGWERLMTRIRNRRIGELNHSMGGNMKRSASMACSISVLLLAIASGCGDSTTSPSPAASSPPPPPPSIPDITGRYSFTVTASGVCDQLPVEFRTRSYVAVITQDEGNFQANVTGGEAQGVQQAVVSGTIDFNGTVSLAVSLLERVNSQIYSASGAGNGNLQGDSIAGSLNGQLQYARFGRNELCNATNHSFEFVKS